MLKEFSEHDTIKINVSGKIEDENALKLKKDATKEDSSQSEKSDEEKEEINFIIPNKPMYRIFNIEDCAADPHYQARQMVMQVTDPRFGEVSHPGVVPKFIGQEPGISWPGPAVGAHNSEIYGQMLGISPQQLDQYISQGVV